MKINYVQKHFHLTDDQKTYIEEKLEHLKKYRRVGDESTLIQIHIEFFDSKISDQDFSFAINMILPHATVRAEVSCKRVEEGIDLAYEKLKSQLEKYKERS